MLSSNYSDYRAVYSHDFNVINRVYALEKLGRHLYSLKMQHALTAPVKEWVINSLIAVKDHQELPRLG